MSKSENLTQTEQPNSNLLRTIMPELDAIRGLAILMVVFYHGLYWGLDLTRYPPTARIILSGMWIGRLGVNLFFVLSGFLITGLLFDSRHKSHYYSTFYIRRALRILPAYFVTIVFLIALSYAPWRFILLSLVYLSNLTPLFGVPIAYPILWSLAVEEHFYLFWPVIVRKLSSQALIMSCISIVVLSPFIRSISFYTSLRDSAANFVCNEFTWNSIDGLACGALVAVWLRLARPKRGTVKLAVLALTVGAVMLEAIGLPWGIWTRMRPVGAALQIVPWHFLFVALLCFFLILGTSRVRGASQWRPLRFFGEISYGLYLYHLLVFIGVDYLSARLGLLRLIGTDGIGPLLARFVVSFVLSAGLAYLSRTTIEAYFLSLKNKWAPSG